MAKTTNSSNLFSGFNPPKVEKKIDPPEIIEEPVKEHAEIKLSEEKINIDTLIKKEVKKLMDSEQLSESSKKVGRPPKYTKDVKVVSVKVDIDTYKFIKKKGKSDDFDGITDYINYLIKNEMEKC